MLIELLVSLLLASIALAAMPTTLGIIRRASFTARMGTAALAAAEEKLEVLMASPESAADGGDTITSAIGTFQRTWRTERAPGGASVRRVSVAVRWDGTQIVLESAAW
jgi:Tfp pilus assembly protein PilV